jgi:hypothetical protein
MPFTEIFKKNYRSAGFITAKDFQDWRLQVWAVCTKLIFLYEDEQVAGLPRSLAVCK